MRGLPPYQNQLPWQLNIFIYYFIFSVRAIYFASPFDNPIQNLPPTLVHEFRSLANGFSPLNSSSAAIWFQNGGDFTFGHHLNR